MRTFSKFTYALLFCLPLLTGCDNRKVDYKKADQKDVALVLHLNNDTYGQTGKKAINLHGNKLTVVGTKQTRMGVSGHARMFNGSDEYMVYNKPMSFPTQTISFWVKPLVTPDMRSAKSGLMGLQDQPGPTASWRWLINRNYDRTVSFVIYDPKQAKSEVRLRSKGRIEDSVWNHVAITIDTVDKGLVVLYINGKKEAEKRLFSNQAMGSLYIGTNKEKGYFKGELDEIVVLTKTLGKGEIKALADKKKSTYFTFLVDPSYSGARTKWKRKTISTKKKKKKKVVKKAVKEPAKQPVKKDDKAPKRPAAPAPR